jgi:PAT family beta-lactamase induction signal transducer AmpG
MSESRERGARLALFAAVYFSEGACLTYFHGFNVLYLRAHDLSYSLIGIVGGITLIPFVLKILIGLLSDRVSLFGLGHRRPFIVIGLLLQTIGFMAMPFIDPAEQFPLYLTMIILAAIGMSTYDTTSDGLSIDTTPEADRGLVQGIMVGARAVSSVLTALVIGLFLGNENWRPVFWFVAALGLLTLVPAFMAREGQRRKETAEFSREAFRSFRSGRFLLFLLLGIIYPLALYSAQGMVSAFLNEGLGIGLSRVSVYTSVFGVGTACGGLIGGPLMRRIGQKRSVIAALVLTAATTALMAVVSSAGLMWALVFVFGLAFGYYETVYFAMGMDFCDPRIAAFMFSIIMAVGNIGIGAGQPIAGILVDALGFRPMFAIFAAVHLLALPVIFAIFGRRFAADGGRAGNGLGGGSDVGGGSDDAKAPCGSGSGGGFADAARPGNGRPAGAPR